MADSGIWNVYAKQLFAKGLGLPLWDGHPNSDFDELVLGSIVYQEDGGKLFPLFNAMESADSPRNQKGVPDTFSPLNPQNLIIKHWDALNQREIVSKTISVREISGAAGAGSPDNLVGAAVGLKFSCRQNSGAILLLDPPAVKDVISSRRRLVTHIREHFDTWLWFANETCGLGIEKEGLWFISGTTKTTKWANAAFEGEYHGKEGSIQCDFGNIANVNLSLRIENEILSSTFYNHGPRRREPSQTSSQIDDGSTSISSETCRPDQCIFINYYKMKKRLWWTRKITAGAGPHELPPPDSDDGDSSSVELEPPGSPEFEEVPGPSKLFDPVDVLLNYILENSEAEIAIACDRDFVSIFNNQEIPEDLKAGLETVKPPIDIDEDGVGTIIVDIELPSEHRLGSETLNTNEDVDDPKTAEHDHDPASTEGPEQTTEGEAGAEGPQTSTGEDEEDGLRPEQREERKQMKQPIVWEPVAGAHTGAITALAVSPDSKWVASGSDDKHIVLWDASTQTLVRKQESHGEVVWDLAFSPDSERLASAGGEGRIMVWDVERGTKLAMLEGHSDMIHCVLASASDDATVRVWDASTSQELYVLDGHDAMVIFVVFSSDGTMMASGGADYSCRIWNVDGGALRYELQGHNGMVWTAAFDPASRRIATASDDGSVRIWSTGTGDELVILHEHHGPVWTVAFSADGKRLLSASSDATIRICDSYSGERVAAMDGHDSMVNSAFFSSDGQYVASASADNTVKLWKVEGGACVRTFNEHNDKVTHALFTPDARMLASGSDDGTVRIRVLSDWV
ncbi:hypothetical protein C8Q80DRAFT_1273690 [Daedaleopsis nitida]|nr:hypothetical protein C8Q80DRAFT_1273690 [Daedaleopsis nitida]